MDVDTITFNKLNSNCYNCRKKGYFSCNCPEPKKPFIQKGLGPSQNRGQENYRGNNKGNRWGGYKGNQNNRGKPPQKKNANQFKTHICALITENCEEMPEDEKEKFMTEMAEDF